MYSQNECALRYIPAEQFAEPFATLRIVTGSLSNMGPCELTGFCSSCNRSHFDTMTGSPRHTRGIGFCQSCAAMQCRNYDYYKNILGVIMPPLDVIGQPIETQDMKIAMVMDRSTSMLFSRGANHGVAEAIEGYRMFAFGFRKPKNNNRNLYLPDDMLWLIAQHLQYDTSTSEDDYAIVPPTSTTDIVPANISSTCYSTRLRYAMNTLATACAQNPRACMLCCTAGDNTPGFVSIIHHDGAELCNECSDPRQVGDVLSQWPRIYDIPPVELTLFDRGLTMTTLAMMRVQRLLRNRRKMPRSQMLLVRPPPLVLEPRDYVDNDRDDDDSGKVIRRRLNFE